MSDMEKLLVLVESMRRAQKDVHRAPTDANREAAEKWERNVDAWLREHRSQRELF